MGHEHVIVRCVCGNVRSQCRCIGAVAGKNVTVKVTVPCRCLNPASVPAAAVAASRPGDRGADPPVGEGVNRDTVYIDEDGETRRIAQMPHCSQRDSAHLAPTSGARHARSATDEPSTSAGATYTEAIIATRCHL